MAVQAGGGFDSETFDEGVKSAWEREREHSVILQAAPRGSLEVIQRRRRWGTQEEEVVVEEDRFVVVIDEAELEIHAKKDMKTGGNISQRTNLLLSVRTWKETPSQWTTHFLQPVCVCMCQIQSDECGSVVKHTRAGCLQA